MAETWKPVPGYEGFYEVSDLGRVYSVPRQDPRGNRIGGKILKQSLNRGGYPLVGLNRDGNCKSFLVHRIVLMAYVGPPQEGEEALHGDGNRTNGALVNLRWGTRSENNYDQVQHGTHPELRKTHCPRGHAYIGENLYVNPKGSRVCRTCRTEQDKKRYLRRMGRAEEGMAA